MRVTPSLGRPASMPWLGLNQEGTARIRVGAHVIAVRVDSTGLLFASAAVGALPPTDPEGCLRELMRRNARLACRSMAYGYDPRTEEIILSLRAPGAGQGAEQFVALVVELLAEAGRFRDGCRYR